MSPFLSEFSNPWHDVLAVLSAILLVVVPVEQILTLKILGERNNRRKRLTPYLINLAVANLVFVFSSLTFSLGSNLSRRYIANKATCIVFGYLQSASVLVTFATFAACTVIVYNTATELKVNNVILNRRKDTMLVLGMWLYCFVILIPTIIIWNRNTFHPNTFGCIPIWPLKTPEDIAYFVIFTILGFSMPMIVNFVYSVKIYLFFGSNMHLLQMSYSQRKRYQEYKKVSKMMITSVVVYSICWTPFTIVGLVSLSGYTPSPALRAIPYLMSMCGVLFNSIIYAIFNAK